MTTLSIPNVTDSYAQGITGLFQGTLLFFLLMAGLTGNLAARQRR